MKIIVINGRPRAGKDTFVELCKKHCNWCLNVSTVDFVKQVAEYCGWDGTKTAANRKFLSDLKDLLTEWNDVPYKKVVRALKLFEVEVMDYDFDPEEDAIAFIHCREPKEIKRLCDELGAQSLLITRDEVEEDKTSNHADEEVFNYKYDYIIANDDTLQDLEDAAVKFLTDLELRYIQ